MNGRKNIILEQKVHLRNHKFLILFSETIPVENKELIKIVNDTLNNLINQIKCLV